MCSFTLLLEGVLRLTTSTPIQAADQMPVLCEIFLGPHLGPHQSNPRALRQQTQSPTFFLATPTKNLARPALARIRLCPPTTLWIIRSNSRTHQTQPRRSKIWWWQITWAR